MKTKNRLFAMLMALTLVLTYMPAMAFADAGDDPYWEISAKDNENEVYLDENGEATLEVETTISGYEEGEEPEISYSWHGEEGTELGTDEQITVSEPGEYTCEASDGSDADPQTVQFTVYAGATEWSWDAWADDYEVFLTNGSAIISVTSQFRDEAEHSFDYQWSRSAVEDGEYVDISGATDSSYRATEAGYYRCTVTLKVNGEEVDSIGADTVVYSWRLTNDESTTYFKYGEPVTLTAETDYTGNDITYQWSRYDEDGEGYVAIDGATKSSYNAGVLEEDRTEFRCEVTAANQTQYAYLYASMDISDYKTVIEHPDAAVKYETCDGRKLTYDFTNYDYNLPYSGDKITLSHDGEETVYTFSSGEFLSEDGEDICFDVLGADVATQKIYVNIYRYKGINHAAKTETYTYDIVAGLNAKVTTDVSKISFEPSNIKLYSEDIKEVRSGNTYYDLYSRNKYKDEDGDDARSCFLNGDKLTVVYANGGGTKVYTFDTEKRGFVGQTEDDLIRDYDIDLDNSDLEPGNNTINVSYHGISTTVKVLLETPESRKEQARQGTYDKAIPKVKIKKPKAAKKAATVKWKKFNKKQIKKSKATKYEIWVCPNKAFGANDTIIKTAGIKKASLKVKGLKKGTYYVKVRAIRYDKKVKKVGAWSAVKAVKIKK